MAIASVVAQAESEETPAEPRLYADPEGRFSFKLVGDWVKLPVKNEEGIAGSFLLTREVEDDRKVVAELVISFAELEGGLSLERYAEVEDRRAMSTPGFKRVGKQKARMIGGCQALVNRYSFSQPSGREELRHKIVVQYYALKGRIMWGMTLTVLQKDESILAELERSVIDSFRFSVPEDALASSSEVLRRVAVEGERGGFSLDVPETWEVDLGEGHGATFRGPGAVIHAFAVPAGADDSPDKVAARFLKERETLSQLRVLSQEKVEVGTARGHAVEYSGKDGQRNWRVRLVAFVVAKKVFFLHCVALEEGWGVSGAVLGQIERSFLAESQAHEPGEKD
jgi:hypothetical protein